MKVLFIRSGNNVQHPISTLQGNSLQKIGLSVEYYNIVGKGIFGYLLNVFKLRKYIKSVQPDILHANYSLTAFVTTLTFSDIPIVVSLMGSDVYNFSRLTKIALKVFILFWKSTIVKSEEMYLKLGYTRARIIPNGVDLSFFYPMNILEARKKLFWDQQKKHILFASDPRRPEKNFYLAKMALERLKREFQNFEIHFLMGIPMDEMVCYYNAADLLLMTSNYEGSPNVIKEAMACNIPIVSTDVGDVKENINGIDCCFVCKQDASDIAEKLALVLSIDKRTKGRDRILELGLDSESIAQKIVSIYKRVAKK